MENILKGIALDNHEQYRRAISVEIAEMELRIEQGADFDAEIARFELKAQLLREKFDVYLWDGPTTARGYRHPSWPVEIQ